MQIPLEEQSQDASLSLGLLINPTSFLLVLCIWYSNAHQPVQNNKVSWNFMHITHGIICTRNHLQKQARKKKKKKRLPSSCDLIYLLTTWVHRLDFFLLTAQNAWPQFHTMSIQAAAAISDYFSAIKRGQRRSGDKCSMLWMWIVYSVNLIVMSPCPKQFNSINISYTFIYVLLGKDRCFKICHCCFWEEK